MLRSHCVTSKKAGIAGDEHHELAAVVGLGFFGNRDTHFHSRGKSGIRHDANEYSLSARDDFYSEPRQSKIDRLPFTFRKWLDFRTRLCGHVPCVRLSDVVVRCVDWDYPGDLRVDDVAANYAGTAPAHG